MKPENLLTVLRKLSGNIKYAFGSAMICGILAHLYMFMNKLPNYDDLSGLIAYGQSTEIGRWFLWFMGDLRRRLLGNFSMPWFNGIFFITCIAVFAGMLVHVLGIKDKLLSILVGGITVAFPAVMGTIFFMFTIPFYGIALLLSGFSALLFTKKQFTWNIGGVVCGVLSLGVYQAYYPLGATIMVLYLMRLLLEGESFVQVIRSAFRYLFLLVVTIVIYLVVTKLFWGDILTEYQGADQMGRLKLSQIPSILKNIYRDYLQMMRGEFKGLNSYLIIWYCMKALYLFSWVGTIWWAVGSMMEKRRDSILKGVLMLVFAVMLPIAMFGIYLMGSNAYIYSLMYYPLVLLFVYPLMLLQHYVNSWEKRGNSTPNWKKAGFGVLQGFLVMVSLVSVLSYCHYDNEYYLQIDLCFKQAQSNLTTLATRIKSVEGYKGELQVAYIGTYQDDTYYTAENFFPDTYLAGWSNYILSGQYVIFMERYCGYRQEVLSDTSEFSEKEEVIAMPCYPDDGSIQVVDGVIVVKFS